jgi:hypothetical protein
MGLATQSRYLALWGPFNFIIKTYKVWTDGLDPFYKFIFNIVNLLFLSLMFYFIYKLIDDFILTH